MFNEMNIEVDGIVLEAEMLTACLVGKPFCLTLKTNPY